MLNKHLLDTLQQYSWYLARFVSEMPACLSNVRRTRAECLSPMGPSLSFRKVAFWWVKGWRAQPDPEGSRSPDNGVWDLIWPFPQQGPSSKTGDTLPCFHDGATWMHPIVFQMKGLGHSEVQCLIKVHGTLSARSHATPRY